MRQQGGLSSWIAVFAVMGWMLVGCGSPTPGAGVAKWTHRYIANPLPGEAWGAAGPVLADFDGDGDLDACVTRRTTRSAYWYENRQGGEEWKVHLMGEAPELESALGAVSIDLNRDGRPDVATSGVWFENPGTLGGSPDSVWPAHSHEGTGHDMVTADINGDGWDDIVANLGAVWFESPDLTPHPVGKVDLQEYHGGVAPNGVGDLDGDGDVDIVQPGRWFENPGPDADGEWDRHPWPWTPVEKASYGPSIRSWVVDLNGDGAQDIVYSNCDTGYGHVYWVANLDHGKQWQSHRLEDPGGENNTGSFHSLVVADFDQDGDLDIFSGEQEDPDTYMVADGKLPMKPEGLKERGVVWENLGPVESPKFAPVVFHVDNPGWHETVGGDIDGDGDLDLVTKIWNSDVGRWTASYWRNDNVRDRNSKGATE